VRSILIGSILILAGCSRELPPGSRNNFRPYGIQHATLHFEYYGDVRGTEDLFIDSFGSVEAHIIHSEAATEQGFRPTYRDIIRSAGELTIVDSVRHVEVKMIDRTMDSLYRLESSVPTAEEAFANNFKARGYQLSGDTTVLGLRAHVWERMGTNESVLEWRGIAIGNAEEFPGHLQELRLTSIDTVSPVPAGRFVPPPGFPVRDLTKANSSAPPPMAP